MNKIEELFKMLDDWRKLPAYQLERRADIFFALYLEEIVKNNKDISIDTKDELKIIPEFPILKKLYDEEIKDFSSVKVDYFVWNKTNPNKSLFIELKTEMNSRNSVQDNYLKEASKLGIKRLIKDGIMQAFLNSPDYRKYFNLLEYMSQIGLLGHGTDRIKENNLIPVKGERRISGWTKKAEGIINQIMVVKDCNPRVVYIQPLKSNSSNDIEIVFDEIIETITSKRQNGNDHIAHRFCTSLKEWRGKLE